MSDAGSVSVKDEMEEEEYAEEVAEEVAGAAGSAELAYEADEDAGEKEDARVDKDGDALYIQHGAHRDFVVPEKFILHRAPKKLAVEDGDQLGEIIASRALSKWDSLSYQHVYIVGGPNKTTQKVEQAPYVLFQPPQPCTSDDAQWLRPISGAVMMGCKSQWVAALKEKYTNDPDKLERIMNKYAPVFDWSEDKLDGPRLNPERLGVGKGGFLLLKEKLKSIRVAPPVVPRNTKTAAPAKAKLSSAISKKPPRHASSDDHSEASEFTQVPEAKTVLLGSTDSVQCFVVNGNLYATMF